MMDCVFCKIRDRQIPKEFTYEDTDMMVFPDIHPIRPTHLLIVPKKHIEDLLDIEEDSLMKKTIEVVKQMIRESKLDKKGYRIGINGGGAQIIRHLHVHLFGPMGKNDKL